MDVKLIVKYLTLLELPLDKFLTIEKVKENYRKLSHVYHPDAANERYKDGKKFIELKEAYEYVINHINEINKEMGNEGPKQTVEDSQPKTQNEPYSPAPAPKPMSKKKRLLSIFIPVAIVVAIVLSVVLPITITSATRCSHSYSMVHDSATCETSGQKTYKCSKCGDEYTIYSQALGHNFMLDEAHSTDPTCTAKGNKHYQCTRCSKTKDEEVSSLGHNWGSNDKCSRCGASKYIFTQLQSVPFEVKNTSSTDQVWSRTTVSLITYTCYDSYYGDGSNYGWFYLNFSCTLTYRYSSYSTIKFKFQVLNSSQSSVIWTDVVTKKYSEVQLNELQTISVGTKWKPGVETQYYINVYDYVDS